MKSLKEILNENLVRATSRLRLGEQELFDSPQISHEDVKMALQQVGDLYERLKQIDGYLTKMEKKGLKNFDGELKIGDRMRATMFGKEWDCTVTAFAWDEDRDSCIPIGMSDDKQIVIPQLKTRWTKIDD